MWGVPPHSRPELDGNELAKDTYLREKQVIEKCLSNSTEGCHL